MRRMGGYPVVGVIVAGMLIHADGRAVAADEGAEARVRAWMPTTVAEGDGVFQYAVSAKTATGGDVTAYLWLPAATTKIRGLVMGGDLMMEANFIVDPVIRAACAEQGIGILFFMKHLYGGFDKADQERLSAILAELAALSHHPELATVALMPIGHSAASPTIGTILHAMPDRCFAALTYKGAHPIPVDKPTERVRGIPTLHVQDFVEEYKDRRETGSIGRQNVLAIRAQDPELLSGIVEDNGSKHAAWCFRLTPLIGEFIRAAAELRIAADGSTRPVPTHAGVLVDGRFAAPRHPAAAAAEYAGDPREALWYPSIAMARMLTDYNAVQLGKPAQYLAFVDPATGAPLPEDAAVLRFVEADVFEVQATFLPKAGNPALPQDPVTPAAGPILFAAHGRRLVSVGPNRFRLHVHPTAVRWYRLSAYNMGDATHRFEEILATVSIAPQRGGTAQSLDFPDIGVVKRDAFPLALQATSSAGLPVRFTVEYGPAAIRDGNRLALAEIPARATFPLRIAVTAYQFGSHIEPHVQEAVPVRRILTVE